MVSSVQTAITMVRQMTTGVKQNWGNKKKGGKWENNGNMRKCGECIQFREKRHVHSVVCRVPAQKRPFRFIKQWCEASRHKLKEMLLP